jgi:hypothetical protein
MRRTAAMLSTLTLVAATAVLAASPAAGAVSSATARFSRDAATPAERSLLGPELLGKVTEAGKVGRIDATVGDLVVREAQVSGGVGARSALGPATAQAATVLHGSHTRTIFSSSIRNYRIVVAVQENQSKQVRAYAKGHLYLITNNSLIATFHRLANLISHNHDFDSAGDGCGPYPSGVACTYATNPPNCEGSAGPCADYYALGQYRHKCGKEGWNCNNTWETVTVTWEWWDGEAGSWRGVGSTCSYEWNVLRGNGFIACLDT